MIQDSYQNKKEIPDKDYLEFSCEATDMSMDVYIQVEQQLLSYKIVCTVALRPSYTMEVLLKKEVELTGNEIVRLPNRIREGYTLEDQVKMIVSSRGTRMWYHPWRDVAEIMHPGNIALLDILDGAMVAMYINYDLDNKAEAFS